MNIESLRTYCIQKKGVTEEFPFDEETLVFKVMGKIFAILPLERINIIALKCDPEYAIELREQYDAIEGAWHLNKKHWNQIALDGSVSNKLSKELVDHSYELIVSKLPKKLKLELADF